MIQTFFKEFKLDTDKKKELDRRMTELLEFCQGNKIPMFATVAIANDEHETQYENIVYGNMSHDIELKDDRIRKHMLIAKGFDAVPVRDSLTINMSEVLNGDTK